MKRRYKDTYYIVYSDGRIYSEKTKRFLKPRADTNGYLQVALRINGNTVEKLVHRLVAKSFLKRKSESMVVNHKDFDITNNHVDNLEWVSQKENIHYSFSRRRYSKRIRKVGMLDKSGKLMKEFETINQAERETGIKNISRCCRGLRKTAGGYRWRWLEKA